MFLFFASSHYFIAASAKNAFLHPPPKMFWTTICELNCTNWEIYFRDSSCVCFLFTFFRVSGIWGCFLIGKDKPTKIKVQGKARIETRKRTRSKQAKSRVYFFHRKTTQKTVQLQETRSQKDNKKQESKTELKKHVLNKRYTKKNSRIAGDKKTGVLFTSRNETSKYNSIHKNKTKQEKQNKQNKQNKKQQRNKEGLGSSEVALRASSPDPTPSRTKNRNRSTENKQK